MLGRQVTMAKRPGDDSEFKLAPQYSGRGSYTNHDERRLALSPGVSGGYHQQNSLQSHGLVQPYSRPAQSDQQPSQTTRPANESSGRQSDGRSAAMSPTLNHGGNQIAMDNRTSSNLPAGRNSLLNLGSVSSKQPVQVTYARLYRKVYRSRVKRMHFLIAFFSVSLSIISFIDTRDTWSARSYYIFGASAQMWLFAIVLYMGCLPVYILKKSRMTVRKNRYSSNLERIQGQLLTRGTFACLLVFALSAMFVSLGYMLTRNTVPNFFDILVHGTRSVQINERPLFIFWCTIAFAFVCAGRYLIREEDCIVFPIQERTSMGRRVAKRLAARLQEIMPTAVIHTVSFWVVYRLCRKSLYMALRATPARPMFALAMRKNLVTFKVVAHAFLLNILLSCAWQFVMVIVEVYCTQFIDTISSSPTPTETLIDGICVSQKALPHQKIMAFGELTDVAIRVQRRRVEIFESISTTPTAFRKVSTECLKIIGSGYVRVGDLVRAQDQSAQPNKTATTVSKIDAQATNSRITQPRDESSIFVKGPVKQGLAERLFQMFSAPPVPSSTTLNQVVAEPSTIRETRLRMLQIFGMENLTEKTEEVKQNVITVASTAGADPASKEAKLSLVNKLMPSWVSASLLTSNLNYQAAMAFEDGYLQMLAIRSLTYLTAASYLEDSYGTVQQELPKILEALCAYLIALDKYEAKMTAMTKPDNNSDSALDAWYGPVKTEIELGLIRILISFNKHMAAFPLTRPHAQRLRELIRANGL